MSAGRHAKNESLGCEAQYSTVVADPQGEAIVTTTIPEEGLIIEAGSGHYGVTKTSEGIVFSAFRAPRHAAPVSEESPGGSTVPGGSREVDQAFLLPPYEVAPVEVDGKPLMNVVAGDNSFTVSVTDRTESVRIFTPVTEQ